MLSCYLHVLKLSFLYIKIREYDADNLLPGESEAKDVGQYLQKGNKGQEEGFLQQACNWF